MGANGLRSTSGYFPTQSRQTVGLGDAHIITSNTLVLVHGDWCWRDVAGLLRARGHRVTTPTQTGLGERRHLLSEAITLETFVQDLVEHLEAEEVEDVILVGHSFGGMAISGAADRVPQRIRHLVYLDSLVLEDGQTLFDVLPADAPPAGAGAGWRPVHPLPAGFRLRRSAGPPARGWGAPAPDAASAGHLRDAAAPAPIARQRPALHLCRVQRSSLPAGRARAA